MFEEKNKPSDLPSAADEISRLVGFFNLLMEIDQRQKNKEKEKDDYEDQ